MAAGYRLIARVAKAHGTKGEVVAVPASGLPPVLDEGLRVAIVPPALKGSRWHVVSDVETSPTGQLVSLSGINDLGAARELAGKWILASEADLPADFAVHDSYQLMGRFVVDERLGELGRITEVMAGPANDVWVVDGEHGETLIPVVEEMIVDFEPGNSPIGVSIPAGLAPWDTGEGRD
ncbi:ribosome maturation factor RimM [uncultured Parolsenella sp.]|uniref:ribosome maturation factor RimM n=1 Tax=uncultured Parolsenella sp. TaxID=2083008 RepID=UPI0025EDADE2|nr:16S rRNA processing protein RimM [uncultured Parolsenella sp.]